MATKKPDIAALVDKSMTGRNLGNAEPLNREPVPLPFKKPVKQAITVRFDEGDYTALQRVAAKQGTSAAALIRQATKAMIRAENG